MSQRRYTYEFSAIDKLSAPVKKMAGAFGVANMKLQTFYKGIKKKTTSLKAMSGKLLNVKNLLIGSFVTSGITRLGSEVTNTLATFEKFEAVLTNTLGSGSAAQMVLKDITEFAAKTPFQVDELTGSWVKLANQGFRPTMRQMSLLGDLASSTGKSFDQLAEATLDAQTGEFERLKEFGIRAQKSGDKVAFTFKGVKKEVDFTASSIQSYLLGLGELQGVQGASAAIMETTGGKLSNLKDKGTQLKLSIGQALAPVISNVIDLAGRFVTKLGLLVAWIQENKVQVLTWTKILGGVAAAFIGVWVAAKTIMGVQAIVSTLVFSFKLLKTTLNLAKVAQIAFNIVAAMNPLGWIVIAIGAIVLLVVRFKSVREYLAKFARWVWEHHPFKWILDVVNRLFPQLSTGMSKMLGGFKTGFKKAFKYISDVFLWPLRKVLDKLFGIDLGDLFKKTPKSNMTGSRGRLGSGGTSSTNINPYGIHGSGGGGGSTKTGLGVSKGIDTVVAGKGGNVKNITVNLEALIKGGLNITTNTIEQGSQRLKAEIEKLLIDAVNEVNFQ